MMNAQIYRSFNYLPQNQMVSVESSWGNVFNHEKFCFLTLNILLLLTLVWSVMPGNASANEARVIFGGAHNYKPFHHMDEAGQARGFDVALFDELATQLGWEADYKLGNWTVIQDNLAEGTVDVVPMFISEERRERYLFSASFLTTYHLLFGRKGTDSQGSLYELDGKTVAVENGSFGWQELQRTGGDYQLITAGSEAQAVEFVAEGLVDYALVASQTGYKTIADEKLNNVVAISPPLLSVQYAYAVNPQRPELVKQINEGLLGLRQDGTVDALKEQWLITVSDVELVEVLQKALWIILPLMLVLVYATIQLWHKRHQSRIFTSLVDTEKERRRKAETNAEKLAVYDDLTGLPKTTFFLEYLESSLADAREEASSLAICVLKILDLEVINQAVGHSVTGKLIKLEADALAAEHSGFIAHLGQGRFGFIFENIADTANVEEQVRQLIYKASAPYDIESAQIEPSVACGISIFPDNGYNSQQLLRTAELAMTNARKERENIRLYEPAMEPDPRNLTLMTDLSKAIESNALSWVYQPKYAFHAKRIIGAEMLVRWQHPRYGWLPPDLFIPLAEKTGQIKFLTRAVIREATKTLEHWRSEGHDWSLSINVSGNDLADAVIVNEIIRHLDPYASMLTLEVTETAVMKDVNAIIKNTVRLEQAGIKLALDDYGTGYSSLTYLKQLNFDEIKIDMSFVKTMMQSEKDQKIARSSIRLGQELGASMTAEGVEDHDIARVLRDMNCDILQGYGISRPLALPEFMTFSRTYLLPQN